MRVLVLGGSGLVGRAMIELLEAEGIEYKATYRSRPPVLLTSNWMPFSSHNDLPTVFETYKPNVCINCIVQRQVEACESDWKDTKYVNIDLVSHIARTCKTYDTHLIHISTDYVFDGHTQQNMPDSPKNPLQNYGISKLISEYRVQNSGCKYTIVRVPVLYWDKIEYLEESAVTVIAKKILNQIEPQKEDDYSIRRPIYIPDFCTFLLDCAKENKYGIYHFYNPGVQTTKYQIAKQIADILGKPHVHILPDVPNACNMTERPYDTDLRDTHYTCGEHMDFRIGLTKSLHRFIHPSLLDKEYASDFFVMFDLDGTLVNTDKLHYESYKAASGIDIPWNVFEKHINEGSIDSMFAEFSIHDIEDIKERKRQHFLTHTDIQFVDGAQELLEHCIQSNMNIVIVTNTSAAIVEHIKSMLPLLKCVKQWIVREDYKYAKPNDECYALAVQKYSKGEPYKIGFENTINGYNALKNHCQCVYFITDKHAYNYKYMSKQDVYLYNTLLAK